MIHTWYNKVRQEIILDNFDMLTRGPPLCRQVATVGTTSRRIVAASAARTHLYVPADAIASVLAVVALRCGRYFGRDFLDR